VAGEYFFARGGFDMDGKILWAVSGLYACCAILRLARFNVETPEDDDHTRFTGLPSPAAAACICSIFLGLIWVQSPQSPIEGWGSSETGRWVLRVAVPLLCACVGLLMVSRVRYVHLFNRFVSKRQSLRTMVMFVLLVMIVWIFIQHWMLLVPIVMITYVTSGPLYFAYRFLRGRGLLGRRLALAERRRRRAEVTRKPADKQGEHAGQTADKS
jgi:CDP-diacylglycerol--serine O-phosphatidyltransferase